MEILSELCTPDRLRENLDTIDIVLGFLSSGGGRAEKPLAGYIDGVLKMNRKPFSKKVCDQISYKSRLGVATIKIVAGS